MLLSPPPGWWRAWDLEPGVVVPLVVGAVWYAVGLWRLRRSAGPGRGLEWWRPWAAVGAGACTVIALLSPLDAAADALFSVHMVQHLLLLLVVAPLLVAAGPLYVGLWGLPRSVRRRLTRWWIHAPARKWLARLLRPVPVWTANLAILWWWHLPAAYDLAVRNDAVHALEHASFLLAGFAFWWLPFRHMGRRRRIDRGAGVVYVFTSGLQCAALGALITLAGHPWYAVHLRTTAAWGIAPLQDQQVAGLLMWIPAGFAYLAAAAVLFVQWLSDAARRGREGTGSPLSVGTGGTGRSPEPSFAALAATRKGER